MAWVEELRRHLTFQAKKKMYQRYSNQIDRYNISMPHSRKAVQALMSTDYELAILIS